jgi:disulfide bond formation protein DsbB
VNANFPSWLKLDQWFPAMFQPSGFCGDIQWQFLGLSMPQWLAVIMVLQLFALITAMAIELRALTRSPSHPAI